MVKNIMNDAMNRQRNNIILVKRYEKKQKDANYRKSIGEKRENLIRPRGIVKKHVVNEHIDVCLVEEFDWDISFLYPNIYAYTRNCKMKLKTYIYVDDQRFQQCMYLILNMIPVDVKGVSINDIIENIPSENKINERDSSVLTPEEAFVGHCSNIQAWVENDYNPNVLDSRISFPLLERLAEVGDAKAKRVLDAEIESRLSSDEFCTVITTIERHYRLIQFDLLNKILEKWRDKIPFMKKILNNYAMNTRSVVELSRPMTFDEILHH